jgi:hypothetical protein
MVSDAAAKSAAILEERVAKVPAEVARVLASPAPPRMHPDARWVTTGVGASEGPARLLVSLLTDMGIRAQYEPLSAFASGRVARADVCVLFSQSLSPNARLAFASRSHFGQMWVVTAIARDNPLAASLERRDVRVIAHGPEQEHGLLLRVMGAAAACTVAVRIALEAGHTPTWSRDVPSLANVVTNVTRPPAPLAKRTVLVCAEQDPRALEGLRLKLVEGLGHDATVVDVCSVVHGPLQSFWAEPTTVISLEYQDDPTHGLFDRLAQTLRPHHQLVRLRATLPRPLGYFEHASSIDHMVLAGLRTHPRDLCDWPGKGHDALLYDVGHDTLE